MEYYLYHRVPDNMNGKTLHPLNKLRDIFPQEYDKHVEKYKDREHLLNTKIPILNCLWNDVLHFTAVNPRDLYKSIASVGFDADRLVWKNWYKISFSKLDRDKTITCLYRRDISFVPDSRSFDHIDLLKFEEYKKIPPETLEYYRNKFLAGEKPLFFHRIPHILYFGTVDIEGVEIISL